MVLGLVNIFFYQKLSIFWSKPLKAMSLLPFSSSVSLSPQLLAFLPSFVEVLLPFTRSAQAVRVFG